MVPAESVAPGGRPATSTVTRSDPSVSCGTALIVSGMAVSWLPEAGLTVSVGAGASVQLTTTGGTRIYRPRKSAPTTTQTNETRVGENALLEYVPDAIIPYGGARFTQRTRIDLGAGAARQCRGALYFAAAPASLLKFARGLRSRSPNPSRARAARPA